MFKRHGENEYGTGTTFFVCDSCGDEYSITPAVKKDMLGDWQNCLSEGCASYDPHRDADVLFCSTEELQKKKIVSINKLKERRKLKA